MAGMSSFASNMWVFMRNNLRFHLGTFGVCLASLLFSWNVNAQASRARAARARPAATATTGEPTAPVEDIATLVPRLRSANPDEVRTTIDQLSALDDPAVTPHIIEALRSGQPDAVTDRALEALRVLAQASSIEALSEFTHHRREATRRRAYQALSAIRDPRVAAMLEQGLRDSDRTIRGACALALGEINARPAVDTLFRALQLGVIEAAQSIGKLGDARAVERYNEFLGVQPLSVMLSGYGEFLRRNDIPEASKVAMINRLGEVSGTQVRQFIAQYASTFSPRDRGRLRALVFETLRRIPVATDTTAPAAQPSTTPSSGASS